MHHNIKAKLGMLVYEQAQPMDIIGPWEVFAMWKNVLQAPIEMYLISAKGTMVHCDSGITLEAPVDFEHCPDLDYLIIPGGRGRLTQMHNAKLLAFIKKQAAKTRYMLSVCTGAFLLYQAGVLVDEPITTYWRALPELLALQDVQVKEQRVVKSGKIWTSGGVSSGIDLALELIAEVAGKAVAGQVQLLFEYFPETALYASLDTASTLPNYKSSESLPSHVPQYIVDYIKSKS